jgi:ATP-dependent DNA helicase RecG
MDEEQVNALITAGEGQNIEFKKKARNLQDEMVAFANAEGGQIIIGVDDSRQKVGVKEDKINDERSKIIDQIRDCEPDLNYDIEKVGRLLVIDIHEAKEICKAPSGFYYRQGPSSEKLSRDEILTLAQDSGEISFDEGLNDKFQFPDDFDTEHFREFYDEVSLDDKFNDVPLPKSLKSLGIGEFDEGDFKFNNAGVLMFAQNPTRFFPQAKINLGVYRSDNKADLASSKQIEGPLTKQITKAVETVIDNTGTVSTFEEIKREEKPKYPKPVLREAIVNAVTHRDYANKQKAVQIDIFPNKVVITSPGGLLEGLDIEDLEGETYWRNPRIADLMAKAGMAEEMGTGLLRMKKLMRERGLKEPKLSNNGQFKVTLLGEKGLPNLSNAGLKERQIKVIEETYDQGSVKNSEYQKIADVSRDTAWKDIQELINRDIVEKKGKGRGTKYVYIM